MHVLPAPNIVSCQGHLVEIDVPILDKLTVMIAATEEQHTLDDGTCNFTYSTASPSPTDKDTLHYGDMLKSEDREKFVEAMQKEMSGIWEIMEVVPWTTIPKETKRLPAIWAFQRKRNPDWSINKWKARLNAHGGKQLQGVNYWDTYAPVVNWSTVRLVMILSLLNGFHSRQVDFVQAYTQAPLDCPIYLEVPAGYDIVDG
jgi:hypothetical protein